MVMTLPVIATKGKVLGILSVPIFLLLLAAIIFWKFGDRIPLVKDLRSRL